MPFQVERDLVATFAQQVEVIEGAHVHEVGCVVNFDSEWHFGRNGSFIGGEGEEEIVEFAGLSALGNAELSRYFRVILEDQFLADGLGDENVAEIEFRCIGTDIGILSDCTQFENPLFLAFHLEDNGPHGHWRLSGLELDAERGVCVGHEDSLGWTDNELGELEEVVEGLGVGVEDGEGEFAGLPHCAET